MNSTPRSATSPVRRKRSPSWIPDQHGAWAMITVPAISGAILGGWQWLHLPLLVFWFLGYFFFNAAMLWLKSKRRSRYFPPVRAYAIALAPLGILLVLLRPTLVAWSAAFLPLIAIAVWAAVNRRERGYANGLATILAAHLMLLVTFWVSARAGDDRWGWVAVVFVSELAYFWGTVPHVKALIRDRNRPAAATFSGTYHTVVAGIVLVAVALSVYAPALAGGWAFAGVWVALAARAWMMPLWQRRRGRLKPIVIGMTEIVFSLLVAASLLI